MKEPRRTQSAFDARGSRVPHVKEDKNYSAHGTRTQLRHCSSSRVSLTKCGSLRQALRRLEQACTRYVRLPLLRPEQQASVETGLCQPQREG